jgi:hypothetical protein
MADAFFFLKAWRMRFSSSRGTSRHGYVFSWQHEAFALYVRRARTSRLPPVLLGGSRPPFGKRYMRRSYHRRVGTSHALFDVHGSRRSDGAAPCRRVLVHAYGCQHYSKKIQLGVIGGVASAVTVPTMICLLDRASNG